jgi:two-component system response regulator (stage 0 sporulation protein F)
VVTAVHGPRYTVHGKEVQAPPYLFDHAPYAVPLAPYVEMCYFCPKPQKRSAAMAKILIVDDEEHIRFLYSEELTEAGYEVITADSGYKLLERIEEEKPDLVVLDIKMVDYNGLDLLQDIRNKYYDLPVVLCTAYDTFKEDMKSIAADYYVIKSFDLTELKNKIAMALEAGAR